MAAPAKQKKTHKKNRSASGGGGGGGRGSGGSAGGGGADSHPLQSRPEPRPRPPQTPPPTGPAPGPRPPPPPTRAISCSPHSLHSSTSLRSSSTRSLGAWRAALGARPPDAENPESWGRGDNAGKIVRSEALPPPRPPGSRCPLPGTLLPSRGLPAERGPRWQEDGRGWGQGGPRGPGVPRGRSWRIGVGRLYGQDRVNRASHRRVAQSLTGAACFCSIVNRGSADECPDDDVTAPQFRDCGGRGGGKTRSGDHAPGARTRDACGGGAANEAGGGGVPAAHGSGRRPGPRGGDAARRQGCEVPGHLLHPDRRKVWLSPRAAGGYLPGGAFPAPRKQVLRGAQSLDLATSVPEST